MRVRTDCGPLDELLGGGVETGAVTLLYGEASTGKTNFCLQTSRSVAVSGLRAHYIDTEGVSIERLAQICGEEKDHALKRILFSTPRALSEQTRLVERTSAIEDVGLIVVDSFNLLYRLEIAVDQREASQHLFRQLGHLAMVARDLTAPVVLTGQVYGSGDGEEVLPFGWKTMEHMAKTILRFTKLAPGRRRATLMKHRSREEGLATDFSITGRGLE